jgi:UDP-N-acetylmuramoyl-tripeptide--D-alanyl-D-alanine ligase
MKIDQLHTIFLNSSGVCTDTRKLKKHCIFFALKGDNFDGNKYASKALELGASYAIIDDLDYQKDERYILVNNALKTLQKLANYHRNQLQCPVIGITGTNGKTTTKELIHCVLSSTFKTASTSGNLNNDIGVPLTILSTKLDTEMLIVEMGANHIGEINTLCKIADIDYGIITNIGKAHLEGFGSYENIKKTKNELYQFIHKKDKIVFVNRNDALLLQLSEKIERVFYTDFKSINNEDSLACVVINDKEVKTKLVGSYNTNNIVAAYTIASYFKVNEEDIINALQKYTPSNNRSELKITNSKNTLILDAYNANPSSMSLSIDSFLKIRKKSLWLILGDMLELGQNSLNEHQKVIDSLKEKEVENVILIGNEFGKCKHSFNHFKSVEKANEWIKENPIINCQILLKGSRGISLERLEKIL